MLVSKTSPSHARQRAERVRVLLVKPVSAVLGHPLAPVLPTLTANTAVDIGRVSSMLQVVSTRCREGGLERFRPLMVNPRHTPNLVRCQVQIAKHAVDRLARIDRIHELLAHINW